MSELNCQGCGQRFVSAPGLPVAYCQRCYEQRFAPSIARTGTWFTPETLRRGIEAMKAGDATKRREMPVVLHPAQTDVIAAAEETGQPYAVSKPIAETSYTVAREAERKNAAQDWLIAYDEVLMILNQTVKVGTHEGRNMVFNKREAAAKITQIVNDRFNAKKAGS